MGWAKGKGATNCSTRNRIVCSSKFFRLFETPTKGCCASKGGCPCPWPGLQLVNNAHVFGHEFNLGANRVTRIQFVTVVANGNGNGKAKGLWLYSKGIWERDKLAWQIFASRPLFGVLRSQSQQQQQQQPPRDLLMQTMRIWYWKLTP